MPDPIGVVINDAPGKCAKCSGTGRYKWEEGGQQRAGRCFSCNGTGRQSKAQMLKNEIYNRWRNKMATTGMDNLRAAKRKCIRELDKTQFAEFCNGFSAGWDMALTAAYNEQMLKGVSSRDMILDWQPKSKIRSSPKRKLRRAT